MYSGKFPFVSWSRGWYADDTENNYGNMAGDNINDDKSNGSVAMREENMTTLRGAVEISKLVSKNRYDESSKYSRLKFLIHEIHNAYF